jgi:hypothetical protein
MFFCGEIESAREEANIVLMMEAVRTSETSICFGESTRRYFQKAVILTIAAVRT